MAGNDTRHPNDLIRMHNRHVRECTNNSPPPRDGRTHTCVSVCVVCVHSDYNRAIIIFTDVQQQLVINCVPLPMLAIVKTVKVHLNVTLSLNRLSLIAGPVIIASSVHVCRYIIIWLVLTSIAFGDIYG